MNPTTISECRAAYVRLDGELAGAGFELEKKQADWNRLVELECELLRAPIRSISDAAALADQMIELASDDRAACLKDPAARLATFLRSLNT